MNSQSPKNTYSVLFIPEIILFFGLIICFIGFLGLIIPNQIQAISIAGVLCCFWLPGYAVMTILFPYSTPEDRIVTITGTVLISITLLTLGALFCESIEVPTFSYGMVPSVTPGFTSIILLYTSILVFLSLILVFNRSNRTTISQYLKEAGLFLFNQISFAILVCLIIGGFIIAGAWILPITQPTPATELWLLTHEGIAGSYPSSVYAGEDLTSIIGVRNEEGRDTEYLLVTRVNGEDVTTNRFFIKKGEKREFPVTITHLSGNSKERVRITFDLYTSQDQNTIPYRTVSEVVRIL